ncbi:hypothetical protein [Enterocloster bolteae]|nr:MULTISPECIES: hypothetical protein [Enterocloster]EDP17339.1 hypothetical protein CLOBOL_02411 [Enterocloster bolteae ATCC BAA-613]MDU1136546.1 hypothetical protein [Enterocloster bolteae]MDU3285124.1 hypothetical protein [Enterocloster bolteae]
MCQQIKPVSDNMKVVGTACTVDTKDGDNLPIHIAIYSCKPGYVIQLSNIGSVKKKGQNYLS